MITHPKCQAVLTGLCLKYRGLVGGDQPGFPLDVPLPKRRENGLLGLALYPLFAWDSCLQRTLVKYPG
jgi:hypothetical protein